MHAKALALLVMSTLLSGCLANRRDIAYAMYGIGDRDWVKVLGVSDWPPVWRGFGGIREVVMSTDGSFAVLAKKDGMRVVTVCWGTDQRREIGRWGKDTPLLVGLKPGRLLVAEPRKLTVYDASSGKVLASRSPEWLWEDLNASGAWYKRPSTAVAPTEDGWAIDGPRDIYRMDDELADRGHWQVPGSMLGWCNGQPITYDGRYVEAAQRDGAGTRRWRVDLTDFDKSLSSVSATEVEGSLVLLYRAAPTAFSPYAVTIQTEKPARRYDDYLEPSHIRLSNVVPAPRARK